MPGEIELLIKNQVQSIFDHFARCFKARILLFSADGKEVKVGLNQPNSDYCCCIHRLLGEQSCLALDEEKRREAAVKREMLTYQCHAGLIEVIKPVYFQERLLGFVMLGQFRINTKTPKDIEREWNGRFETGHISKCFSKLPYISGSRIDGVLGLFSTLVDYITAQQMIALGGNKDLSVILEYMQKNLHKDISVDDIAKLIGKSRSTVSHIFKQHTGKAFKRALIEMKLNEAHRLLSADPDLSIREASAKVGYHDPLYFSRLHKRIFGYSPSDIRRRQSSQ